MYNIGTVTTTANSPKITGTGTRWKDNTTLISVGQVVLIENGANLLINSIYSIESNTALTLAFPLSAKLTNAKYIILTTMIDSISDGINKATAQVIASEAYTDILNQWMTAQGTIDVELPTGQKVKLRTVAEMDKQLDGKFDKLGGGIRGNNGVIYLNATVADAPLYMSFFDNASNRLGYVGRPDNKTDIALVNSIAGSALRLTVDNKLTFNNVEVMRVGDGGWMSGSGYGLPTTITKLSDYKLNSIGYAYASTQTDTFRSGNHHFLNIFGYSNNAHGVQLGFTTDGSMGIRGIANNAVGGWNTVYTTANTTKDANGNLKAASPIIKVFADDIDPNEEAEGVTLKKLHTGMYQLCGVLGMHSDASWGGINGGITIPSGINQLPLVYVDYDVLIAGERHPFNGEVVQQEEHGDIVIYTSYRKHLDLPQNVQYARLKAYPEFSREVDGKLVELEAGYFIDVPTGHWIDVRVNMPSDSLYNQKQAEAQKLAEIEAERLAKEEAERIAEEAKRVEKEAAERKRYGLGENEILF